MNLAFWLPTRARNGDRIEVALISASEALRHRWDQEIQPAIDAVDPQRTDFNWRWSRAGAFVSGRLFPPSVDTGGLPLPAVEGLASAAEWWAALALQHPHFLALVTGDGVPLAMALVCDAFADDAHFVWMLTGLPRECLGSFFGPDETEWPGLITLGMLWALTHRALRHADGREPKGLLLHADVDGGQSLLDWYRSAGMDRLPAGVRLSHTRRTDDRYLRFGLRAAQAFLARHEGDFR